MSLSPDRLAKLLHKQSLLNQQQVDQVRKEARSIPAADRGARAYEQKAVAYDIVQRNAMAVWEDIQNGRSGPSYRERLDADPEFPICAEELDAIFDPRGFLSRVDVVFDRLEGCEF